MISDNKQSRKQRQAGVTSVEFAIVGLTVFIILFGAIEMGRLMFTLNTLKESTFRGARVAAVCPIGDPKIERAALFDARGTGDSVLPNLSNANIQVDYLDQNGAVVGDTGDPNQFAGIRFVRVQIVNYTHDFIAPVVGFSFTTQNYPTTLPRESLGISREGLGAIAC